MVFIFCPLVELNNKGKYLSKMKKLKMKETSVLKDLKNPYIIHIVMSVRPLVSNEFFYSEIIIC